ncbi:MAG: pyridoxamine 5'-phosphate oxidase, partial [Candidatus Latescibacteria bacterium]|nr:pyridoxamine 5'-phosphate oxidase [Candidatus Latescibacterota bacterium]
EGTPTLRTVLLKMFDKNGFIFFTNYESRKSRHIQDNPNVSILFLWKTLERQVTITGTASKISTAESLKYFSTRPRGSQLGAWISDQSSVISSRKILEQKLQEIKNRFSSGKISLPSFWGGYRVVPKTIEFWQGRPSRLNDRFEYSLNDDLSWTIERLAP